MSPQLHSLARRGALLGLILVAAAVTACGVGRTNDKDKIARATGTYLRALADGDTTRACGELSRSAQGEHCPEAVARRASQLTPRVLEQAADASLGIAVHGRSAVATLGTSRRLRLIKVDGDWRVDAGFAVPRVTSVVVDGGRLVSVGNARRLYLRCVGSGGPTVVLEAGFGGSSADWRDVQPRLARHGRICAYDRAGLGNSVAMPGLHDAGDEVRDLRRLLQVARMAPPYVLVGHSYGGLLVRLFAHAHPGEVAGMVLVDAVGRDQMRRQLAIWPRSVFPAVRRELARTPRDGVDLAAGAALDRRVDSLRAMPLAVITAGRHDAEWGAAPNRLRWGLDRLWIRMQDELAGLSRDHVHVVALHSDHFVQRLDGQPIVVLRAVDAVARAARRHTHLLPCARVFSGSGVRCR
jgi:pimeloyl-ACP methyl ester carboxylesterase